MRIIYGKKAAGLKPTASEMKALNLSDLANMGQDDFIITENDLYLEGEITPSSARDIITYIIEANNPPVDMPKLTHINLYITSPGGCMDSTFAMISVIRASGIPIRTIAMGTCASGGLMTAISGHVRLVDKYCAIMSHTLSTGYADYAKHADLEEWLNAVKVATEKIVSLYEEHTKLSPEQIKESLLPSKSDVYLTAEQAIGFGLFDGYFDDFDKLK